MMTTRIQVKRATRTIIINQRHLKVIVVEVAVKAVKEAEAREEGEVAVVAVAEVETLKSRISSTTRKS